MGRIAVSSISLQLYFCVCSWAHCTAGGGIVYVLQFPNQQSMAPIYIVANCPSSLEVVGGEKSHSCLVTGGEYVQATCYTLDVNRSLQNWLRYETYKLCNLRAEQYEETASYYHPPGR